MKNLRLLAVLVSLLLLPGCSGGKKPAVVKPANPRIFATLRMGCNQGTVTSVGLYEVTLKGENMGSPDLTASISIAYIDPVTYKATRVWSLRTTPISTVHLVDLNNDQFPEVYVNDYSGGAHCCTQHIILQLDPAKPRVTKLMDWDGASTGVDDPASFEFLTRGKFAEIISVDYRFAYFSDLSFATTPVPNKIFTLRNGKYVSATSEFPDRVRKWRQEEYGKIQKLKTTIAANSEDDNAKSATTQGKSGRESEDLVDGDVEDCKTAAMTAYVYGVMLDEEKQTFRYLSKAVPPIVSDWLIQYVWDADKLIKESPL